MSSTPGKGTPGKERWELLEMIGAYAAGELDNEEARETERLLLANEDRQRLVESYSRMFVLLSVMGQESPEAPDAIINHAIRRAYISAFLRGAEDFVGGLGRSYAGAFVYYLGLRPREA
jgi:anti-sigma-K factor RskA